MDTITSLQNQRIKEVMKLTKRAERDQRRLTVVEGLREVGRALQSGVQPVEAYLCPALIYGEEGLRWQQSIQKLAHTQATRLFEVTPEVYAKLAYREDGDGFLLVIPYLPSDLEQLPLGSPPFLCVIEGVEKPGNLGAILRTADAAGVNGVIVCAGATDLHNPNVIRASLGARFTVPVAEASPAATIAWLRRRQIQIVAATPEVATNYTQVDLRGSVAVVMGSEADGLGAEWLAAADQRVSIPMYGAGDSLNLSIATALLLYEVVRQRGE
jgi:TrmH family RNA methyltransferase